VGYFYVNDRKFYLYAKKRTVTLREATSLIFELADTPIPSSVRVEVEGIPFTNFVVRGNELIIKLDDDESFVALWMLLQLDVTQWDFINHGFAFGPSNQVRVTYDALQWVDVALFPEPTGNQYQRITVTELFLIKEADDIEYQLTRRDTAIVPTAVGDADPLPVPTGFIPDPPKDCAPVVITDDGLAYPNPIDYQVEFAVDPLTGEILFNANRNFLQNPSFEITSTGVQYSHPTYRHPLEWRVTDPTGTPAIEGTAYHGDLCYQILGTGIVDQTVRINPRQNYTVSIFLRDGTGELCVNFLDLDRLYIDLTGGISTTAQPNDQFCHYSSQTGAGEEWQRLQLYFGQLTGGCDDPEEIFPIPSAAEYMEVRLRRIAGAPCFDAAILEEGLKATQFFGFDPSGTVEYETGESGFLEVEPASLLLPEIDALELNPLSTPQPGGFLFLEEFSNVDDYRLRKGDISTVAVPSPTGVVEITGVGDLDMGRAFLPYAQVSGWNKLRQRATFHLENPVPLHDVTDLNVDLGNPRPVPATIEWVVTEGLEASGFDPVLVVVPDRRMPVRVDAFVYDRWENPAYVFRGLASAQSGIVDPDDSQTTHAGQLKLIYTPPDRSGVGDLGIIDQITLRVADITRTLPVRGFRKSGLDFDAFLGV
jgi:hypothetical protein